MRNLLGINPVGFRFPGGKPGFDPSHPAAGQTLLSSALAGRNGVVNLVTGAKGVIQGSPAVTRSIRGDIGPAEFYSNTGDSLQAHTWASQSTVAYTAITMAAVFFSTGASGGLISTSGSISVGYRFIISTGTINIGLAANQTALFSGLATNVPYFVAASCINTSGNSITVNAVLVNLATGQTQTFTTVAASGGPSSAGDGTFVVGAYSNAGGALTGHVACAMISSQFNTLGTLRIWAKNPWAFWYPVPQGMLAALDPEFSFAPVAGTTLTIPGVGMTASAGPLGSYVPGVGMTASPGVIKAPIAPTFSGVGGTPSAGSFLGAIQSALASAGATFTGGTITTPSTITLVQTTNSNINFSSPTFSASFGNGIAAGSFIVVAGMFDNTATSVSVTTDLGDSATDSGQGLVNNATVGVRSFVKAFLSPTVGAKTITIIPNVNVAVGDLFIWEFSGISNPIFDKVKTGSDSTTSPTTPSTGTLSAANEAAIAYGVSTLSMTGNGPGWALDGITSITESVGEHQITSSTTAIAGTATQSGGATCQMWVATFTAGPNIINTHGLTSAAGVWLPTVSEGFPGAGSTSIAQAFGFPLRTVNVVSGAGLIVPRDVQSLTGVGVTQSAGPLQTPGNAQVTGASATLIAGLLNPKDTIALTGSGVTAASGSLGGQPFPLPGNNITSGVGSFSKAVIVGNIPGIGLVVTTAGTDTTEIVLASLTTGMAISAGVLLRTIPLLGVGVTASAGQITFTNLAGLGLVASSGSFTNAIGDKAIPGINLVTSAGNLIDAIALALSGAGGVASAGLLGLAPPLVGAGVASLAGLFGVSGVGSFTLPSAGATGSAGLFGLAPALAGAGATASSGLFANVVAVPLSGASVVATPGSFTITTNSGVSITLVGAGAIGSAAAFLGRAIIEPFAGAGVTSNAGSLLVGRSGSASIPGISILAGAGKLAFPIFSAGATALAAPLPIWSINPTLASANMFASAGSIPTSAGSFTFAIPGAFMGINAGIILVTTTRIFPIERFALVSVEQRTSIVPVDRRPILVLR